MTKQNVQEYLDRVEEAAYKFNLARTVAKNIINLRNMSDEDIRLSSNRVNTGFEEDDPFLKGLSKVKNLVRSETTPQIIMAYNRFARTLQTKIDSRKLTQAEYEHFAVTDAEILLKEIVEKYRGRR